MVRRGSVKGADYVNSMRKILLSSIVPVRMLVYYILFEHLGQFNQQAKKLVGFHCRVSCKTCKDKKRNTESTTSVWPPHDRPDTHTHLELNEVKIVANNPHWSFFYCT